MRLFCIAQDRLNDTNACMRAAGVSRGVEVVMLTPDRYALRPDLCPVAGDLLYRAATDVASDRLEKLLWRPGVAAFYDDPFFECLYQNVLFQRHGLPVPRTIHSISRDRAALAAQVEQLGGFPLVLKQPGGEGGQGVIRVDSFAALFSLVDYLGTGPVLMDYFEHVVTYRLVVVGEQVVACEARHAGPDDFRTNAAGGGTLGAVRASEQAVGIAVKAAQLLRVEFGGVDLMENADGKIVLAELNFPCYFADQQRDSGIDIAGAMVDHLIAKSLASTPY
jgi:hypothetical protein